jgi:hypothetical protein
VAILNASVADNAVTINGDGAPVETSNNISDSFNDAAGINVVGQNAGNNSHIQQNVNVQANIEL